ncbi:MAG: NAD(P)H-dependent oxidoreductase [Alphaproteobacteria bacterium]|nr:NAD(P)H-dependent oxidoreductase [Alphaproteobacteria bacterium]
MADIRILGISGSLRKGSYNSAALKTAAGLMPAGSSLEIFDISAVPLYNEDVKAQGFPEPVQRLREKIAAADGLLFATPEYNYSVSGVLKNAIDWASRPPQQPFDDKAVALIGASGGAHGSVRAQYHLRQIGIFLNMRFVNKPEVFIGAAGTRFDAAGNLTDETAKGLIKDLMAELVTWSKRLKKS